MGAPSVQSGDPLQDLIRDFIARNPGEDYSSIARRAGMTKQNVRKLAAEPRADRPKRETVAKLAAGIRRPVEVVAIAAGYPAETDLDPAAQVVGKLFSALDPEDQVVARRIIEDFYARRHPE